MAAETSTGGGAAGLLKNKKVMIGAALVALVVGYFLYKRYEAGQSASSAANDTATDTTPSDDGTTSAQLGGTPASDGSTDSSGLSGDDISSLLSNLLTGQESLVATSIQSSDQLAGQVVSGEQGLFGSVITAQGQELQSQDAVIDDLGTQALGLAATADNNLGSLAASAVGGLTALATSTPSAAAPSAAPVPAQTPAPDIEPNTGTQSAGNATVTAAQKVDTAAGGGKQASGASAVVSGAAKTNTQAAKNDRAG